MRTPFIICAWAVSVVTMLASCDSSNDSGLGATGGTASGLGAAGGAGAGGAPASRASTCNASAFCQGITDRSKRCNEQADEDYAECSSDIRTALARFRAHYCDAFINCVSTQACTADEDDCALSALAQTQTNYAGDGDFIACNAAREACKKADKDTFKDEYCIMIIALGDSARSVARECFKRDCDEMTGCVDSLIDID